jgi:hypothetical protein
MGNLISLLFSLTIVQMFTSITVILMTRLALSPFDPNDLAFVNVVIACFQLLFMIIPMMRKEHNNPDSKRP